MAKKVIPFDKTKRSVKELVDDLQNDMEDVEELLVIGKYKDGDWLFEYSDLENELEWIGILNVFIHDLCNHFPGYFRLAFVPAVIVGTHSNGGITDSGFPR